MAEYVRSAVLDLMRLPDKRSVQKYCRDVTITGSDFANVLLNARIGGLAPYRYASHFDDRQPPHLWPREEELKSLAANGVGTARGKARKAISKVTNMFIERRLFAAHFIYHPNTPEWHLFCFDQRETARHSNHWEGGSHIHYSRHDIVHVSAASVWEDVLATPPKTPKSEHVPYSHDD
jgi:hypothetical protein